MVQGEGKIRDEVEGEVECDVEGGVGILAWGAVVGGIAEEVKPIWVRCLWWQSWVMRTSVNDGGRASLPEVVERHLCR